MKDNCLILAGNMKQQGIQKRIRQDAQLHVRNVRAKFIKSFDNTPKGSQSQPAPKPSITK